MFYEVGNGLMMAVRRKRIVEEQAAAYLARIPKLPISADHPVASLVLKLPDLARTYGLTNYDAAYLELARAGAQSWVVRLRSSTARTGVLA